MASLQLDLSAARAVLNERKNWEPPSFQGTSIRTGTTEKGEKLYLSGKPLINARIA